MFAAAGRGWIAAGCAVLALTANGTVFAAAPAKAFAPAQPGVVFGFPEFSPLSFANARGEPDGYLVRLSDAMFTRAGLHARAVIYPAPRLFENLANGSIDFSMVVHNPVLDACCLYSNKAVVREELRVYHAAGKPPINSKDELSGKKIITIQGFSYAGLITFINDKKNRITNEVAPTHAAAFAMLDAGRADYVLDYAGPAASGLASHPLPGLRFETIDHLDIYLVLSKAYPDAERVLERLTTIAKDLQQDPGLRPPPGTTIP
jgi:ABC-type amino acid transport substrate-binding protein